MGLTTGEMLQSRYRIVSLLGQGGMGAVYRAWDTRLNVPVALKEMTPQPGLDPHTLAQLRRQFRHEAQTLARLNHPHLVDVTDFFEEGGNAYLVMRFIEGESLAALIEREGALPEKQVLIWAGQLLDALAYCHSQGVIHRDVSPQNVIIRPDGQAVLVDFGLVKLWDPHDPHTKTAMRGMGKPEYAPPEQYDIEMGHTDARSDIYGLGATLYHALTGQAPPTATFRMADPEQFVPPRAVVPGVSGRTEAAVLKALELARSQRFQSAAEMAQALGVTVPTWSGEEVTKRTVSPPTGRGGTRVMKGTAGVAAQPKSLLVWRRVPVWVWALGGLAVLTLVVGVVIWVERTGGGSTPTPSPTPLAMDTATVVGPEIVRETATPWLPPSPMPTATRTPTGPSTSTPEPTATSVPSPTPAPTLTPAPRAVSPEPVAPAQGGEYQSPITLQWAGSLRAGQAYQVTIYHPTSGYVIQSELLTDQSWTVDLPGDRVGEWRWSVSVIQNGSAVVTSAEWMFWFNPFPGAGGGAEPAKRPTPKPPPRP